MANSTRSGRRSWPPRLGEFGFEGGEFGVHVGEDFEDGDEIGEPVDLFLAVTQLDRVVEIREIGLRQLLIGGGERCDDLLVDLIADVGLSLERDHRREAGSIENGDRRIGPDFVLVADVLDEQQREDIVLVLAGVHPPAQGVATGLEGGVEFGFFDWHALAGIFWESPFERGRRNRAGGRNNLPYPFVFGKPREAG